MGAAQEFSSPGEHMASQGSSTPVNGGSAYRYPNNPHNGSNVIYATGVGNPPIDYSYINNSYDNYREERGEFGGSARSFNRYYMDYNDMLFNSAKDYDMYMSNTAIQRQIEDLKKAGLNPILAAYLGGAQYKGVNAPYVSLSPASALQAYTQYDSSMYATDTYNMTNKEIAKMQTSSNEFIAQYNKLQERIIQGDYIGAQMQMINMKKDVDEYLENLSHSNKLALQEAGFIGQGQLDKFKYDLDKDFYNFKNGLGSYNDGSNDWFWKLNNKLSRMLPGARGILTD